MKFLAALLGLIVVVVGILLVASHGSTLTVTPAVAAIGAATPVTVHISNPHGVRHIAAYVEQNGQRYTVFDQSRPSTRVFFFGKNQPPRDVTFTAGTKNAPQIKDGKARLVIETVANDFRGSTDSRAFDVEVATRPPRVIPDDDQHYINQGGSELVTFTASGYWTDAGVKVGSYTFESFPMPGRPANERFALFAYPWDLAPDVVPHVFATNPTGTVATGRFVYKLFPKPFRARDLTIDDAFLDKVVNQIDPGSSGDLLQRFLKINGAMRRQNNQFISDLRLKSEPKMMWEGPFQQQPNSEVESHFADVRTYVYHGKKVDQQVHLGYDLAITKHTPILAENNGRVLWAANLGIYGNCVIIDHGYTLESLYGHLSRIDVKPGDVVKKGQVIGISGSTGLAGGDHLHYSMLLDGVQVDPVEWWDGHWLHDRVMSKLAPEAARSAAR